MSAFKETFIPSTVERQKSSFEPLPDGYYHLVIIDSDFVENKAKTGNRLKLVYEIVSGDFQGRKIFDGLNLVHPTPKAQQIAREQLADLCDTLDIDALSDSVQLHNKPFVGKVKNSGDFTNVVLSIKPNPGNLSLCENNTEQSAPSISKKHSAKKVFDDIKAQKEQKKFDDDVPF